MAVARYSLVRKIYYSCVTAVLVIVLRKVAALFKNALPESRAFNIVRAVINIVAEVKNHRNFCRDKFFIYLAAHFRSKARLDRDDRRHVLRVGLPADASALRMR